MKIHFVKSEGTGNDFILIDHRTPFLKGKLSELVRAICHRRMGIGADGVILLEHSAKADYRMRYFNSDGGEASLCGNGSRCLAVFAREMGVFTTKEFTFEASDGIHHGKLVKFDSDNAIGEVRIEMKNVKVGKQGNDSVFLDTGSPHFVKMVDNLDIYPVYSEGIKIRNSKTFSPAGTNVDFISPEKSGVRMRVFERGVEDETLSSGTGAVASAMAGFLFGWYAKSKKVKVSTRGGDLFAGFEWHQNEFHKVYLEGPASLVFGGNISW